MSMESSDQDGSKTKKDGAATKISTLERREIQAPVMAALLAGFIAEIGYDRAMVVASAAIQADALKAGKTMAEKYGSNTIDDLLRLIREEWASEGALELTVLEQSGRTLRFDVTRCRYAEMYDRLGLKEFGFCLSCNRDASLIRGFNPRLKLIRAQTIMQGAGSCDFQIVTE
jgi:hypothetical protein